MESKEVLDIPKGYIRRKKGYLKGNGLIGRRFGRLLVISKVSDNNIARKMSWKCLCDCGKSVVIETGNLIYNGTRSCGCLQIDIVKSANTTHGKSKTPLFDIWSSMKARCYNVNNQYYSDYGGRGIKVCQRWIESFEDFHKDMGNRPSKEHSLDRINVNGDYEPSNCRWATKLTQANNTRVSTKITYDGVTKTIPEWSRLLGINKSTIKSRICRGETDISKILSTKIRKNQFDI